MTTTTNPAPISRPAPRNAAAIRNRVRVGDIVFTEYVGGGHTRRAALRVESMTERTVSGPRVRSKDFEPVIRNGAMLRPSVVFWDIVDVAPGPQTWADAIAENAAR